MKPRTIPVFFGVLVSDMESLSKGNVETSGEEGASSDRGEAKGESPFASFTYAQLVSFDRYETVEAYVMSEVQSDALPIILRSKHHLQIRSTWFLSGLARVVY